MKSFKSFVLGLAVAVAACAGLAVAAVSYPGYFTVLGVQVDLSTDAPVLAITGGSTAQVGGGNTGVYVNTATTAAGTMTFADATPNGRVCDFNDETTPADKVTQGSATSGATVVTIVGTVSAADKIGWSCMGY